MGIAIYFYPIVLALGCLSSYTDIRFRLIRNQHIKLALLAGLLVYLYLSLSKTLPFNYQLIVNILLGISLGFLLYFLRIWGAGDGKLFFAYCLLVPVSRYSQLFGFASIALLINIFLVSLIGVFIISIPQMIKNRYSILKKVFSFKLIRDVSFRILILFAFSWILWSAINKLNLLLPYFFRFIGIVFLYRLSGALVRKANKFLSKKMQYISLAALIATGLSLKLIAQPQTFSLAAIGSYSKHILGYFLLMRILTIALNLGKNQSQKQLNKRIAFAPFMFSGVLLANSNLINAIIDFLGKILR